jgi:hypothetical protein
MRPSTDPKQLPKGVHPLDGENLPGPEIDRFVRSGRPREPGRPFQKVRGEAPRLLKGSHGPPGPARPQESFISGPGAPKKVRTRCTRKNTRVPSSGLRGQPGSSTRKREPRRRLLVDEIHSDGLKGPQNS